MAKAKTPASKFNRVKPLTNVLFSIIFIILAISCVIPLIFVIIISLSSQLSLNTLGYSFLPLEWTGVAYKYLATVLQSTIVNAFTTSIIVTLSGTAMGLALNATFGYVLSRRSFRFRGFFTKMIFIPMLFGGGMVASYLVNTQLLYLKNSYLVLILPLAVSSMNIIIFRTFFQTTVPDSVVESAKIDGATQLRIFFSIVIPISLPAIATIGIFLSIGYWNDWFTAMLYIDNRDMYPLQYLVQKVEADLQFIKANALTLGGALAEMAKTMPSETVRMALVVLVVLPIACTYPFFQRFFVTGLTIGAVKG